MLEITYPEIDDPTFPAAASRLCEAASDSWIVSQLGRYSTHYDGQGQSLYFHTAENAWSAMLVLRSEAFVSTFDSTPLSTSLAMQEMTTAWVCVSTFLVDWIAEPHALHPIPPVSHRSSSIEAPIRITFP
jgi:hypothetical protein